MNLDDCTVYVFIRQDLPIEQQLVQGAHALFRSRQPFFLIPHDPQVGHPNIVFIGMPNLKALQRVEVKLVSNAISHYAWTEPDFDP
jgi:hypothetical protein